MDRPDLPPTGTAAEGATERPSVARPDDHAPTLAIGLDIGSTFTKGALFRLGPGDPCLLRRAATPTTTDHLPDGAGTVIRHLLDLPPDWTWEDLPRTRLPSSVGAGDGQTSEGVRPLPPIHFTSSAKGGLRVAVVGLVPELSVQIGRLVAWSAGARLTGTYSYRLTDSALAEIEQTRPDIVLWCGGTDGGHERNGRENAQRLARSSYDGTLIYAGNALLADEVRQTLAHKRLVVTANVMPEFGRFNGEPAREAIRSIFLQTIVQGKGLDRLAALTGTEPVPTPRAMFDLVGAIADHCPDWREFIAIDLGGATTDVYSCAPAFRGGEGLRLRGLVEPERKRSVEGDLGLRISASALAAVLAGDEVPVTAVGLPPVTPTALAAWVERVGAHPETLPASQEEEAADAWLAAGCIRHALRRHAGRLEPVWLPEGQVWVQTGKDLRPVPRLVLTGGYPAAHPRLPLFELAEPAARRAPELLVPRAPSCFVDHLYLWPLLGPLVARFPATAARLAVASLIAVPAATSCPGVPHSATTVKESHLCESLSDSL